MSESRITGTVREASSGGKNDNAKFVKRRNIVPKILCVIAAFFMWLYVMYTESPEYSDIITSVSVTVENAGELQDSSGLSVYGKSSNIVDVKLTGKKSEIDKLTADDIYAYVDVSKVDDTGNHALKVFVELPDGIDYAEAVPSTISVYVDETDTISLSLREKLENFVLTTPYELGDIKFEYDMITVTGPANKLSNIAEAQVPINMQGKTLSFVTRAPIVLVTSSGEKVDMTHITCSATETDVSVPIFVTKEVPVTTAFKYGYLNSTLAKVTVTPATVTVRADENVFVTTPKVIDTIVIDEKLITNSSYSMTASIKTATGVTLAEDDADVKVTVELASNVKTKQFVTSKINVKGAAGDLSYKLIDKSVSVLLCGPQDQLDKVKNADITLEVDLSGYDAESVGTISKTASVVISTEGTANVYEIGTYSIKLNINQNEQD